MIPSALRSSASMLMPARIAALTLPRGTDLPCTNTVPRWVGIAPMIAFAVSVRPEPSSPASPTTSPGRIVRSTPLSLGRLVRLCASSTGSLAA